MLKFLKQWNRSRKWRRRIGKLKQRKERMLSFGSHAFALLVEGKHGKFAVDPEDDFVSKRLLQTGSYSDGELDLARRFVPENGNVLMVGTHIGALAIPLSKHCGHMVAVEANPNTFKLLQLNLLLNQCDNVLAFNLAAAEKSCSISFILSRDNSGGSKRLPRVNVESYTYDNPQVVEVPADALDVVVENKAFDLIFMDIEGSEYFALKGMPRLLESSRVLVIEFLPHHLKNVAGVSADDFISLILPNFEWMFIPMSGELVAHGDIRRRINEIYTANESHDALVYMKSPLPEWLQDGAVR